MTMMEIVKQLQDQGHEVEFYIRKDGGILVRRIDAEKYPSGSSGNKRARQIVGATLSEARSNQLKYATRQRKVKMPSLDDEIEKEYKRVKRKWNRVFKAKDGKPHPAGYFGRSRIKYAIEHYGKAEALRRIKEAERYASGLAYSKNVEILAMFISDAGTKNQSQELLNLAEDVRANAYAIRDEWIEPAYQELYKLNTGATPEQVANNVRAILRL